MADSGGATETASLVLVDWGVLALYFLCVAIVGLICFLRERRALQQSGGSSGQDEFFLAGRSMGWLPIGLSLFVSNIGSEHLVGLSGSAAGGGMAVAIYELTASLDVLVLGWVFVPIYLRSGISTLPEYLERRYSRRLRSAFSVVTLFICACQPPSRHMSPAMHQQAMRRILHRLKHPLYVVADIFTKLSVSVFSGATILSVLFGMPKLVSASGLVVLTAVYTAMGGLSAVIMTDMAQAAVLIVGAICITSTALSAAGGMHQLRSSPPEGMGAEAWEEFFHLYRPPDHPHLPTLGIALGQTVAGLWYFCLDQAIVQRVLAARTIDDARGATLLCGFLKMLPMFIMVLPGVAARKLYGDSLAIDTNQALPMMMARLLPKGMLGLMLAATVAACMSSLDSVFTASASLICLDLYKPYFRPQASEREFVLVGRLSCVVLALLTLLWMPVIELLSDQIFLYIQSISNYLAPPVVAVYFGGVLWKGATAEGAAAAFVVGYVLGAGRMMGEIMHKSNGGGRVANSEIMEIIFETNYLYIGWFIFVASTSALVLVSLLTSPPDESQITGLTIKWRNPFPSLLRALADCAREPSPAMRSIELAEIGEARVNEDMAPSAHVCTATASLSAQKSMASASQGRPTPKTPSDGRATCAAPQSMLTTASLAVPAIPASVQPNTRTLPRRRRGDRFHALNIIMSSVLIVVSLALIANWW